MLKRIYSFFHSSKENGSKNLSLESLAVYNNQLLYSQESMIEKTPATRDQDSDHHVQSGIHHHELGHLEKATHCFRLASKEGCPVGMFLYGISLRHGWGCRPNCALAFQYLQTAAEHAVHNLLQQDTMLLASKAELIMAIYELGVSFQQGWGVTRNKEVAFYYFEMAANLGDLDAMNDLAFCYLHGHGVRKDVFRAAKYYRMAAKQGQGLVGNSWIWKKKYDIVEKPGWS